METVNIQYEGSFTDTVNLLRWTYVKVLDLGRKYGYTKNNFVFINRANVEKALDEYHSIRVEELKLRVECFSSLI